MPTNLPPEAQAAYMRHLEARTLEDKIKTLEEFLSLIPKHKGTEKLIALHRSRLVKFKKMLKEKKTREKRGARTSGFFIPKEGDIQVVLIGLKGSGKTCLLTSLTNAKANVGKTTVEPNKGVAFCCGGVQFQIIDSPPIFEGASKGIGRGRQIIGLARNADLIFIVIDLSQDVEYQFNTIVKELNDFDIRLNKPHPPIEIERTGGGGILVFGAEKYGIDPRTVKEILYENGLRNATIRILGKVTLRDIVDSLDEGVCYKKAIVVATKGDLPNTKKNYEVLKEVVGNRFKLIPVSSKKKIGLEKLLEEAFGALNFIRVWTRNDEGKVGERPLVLPKGSTVEDAAREIHSSFLRSFKYAVICRKGEEQKSKRVGLRYPLEDGDILYIAT
ncbi:MAG: TGS domain-containing protein [Candidatus Asgardarchaeia archaeon]